MLEPSSNPALVNVQTVVSQPSHDDLQLFAVEPQQAQLLPSLPQIQPPHFQRIDLDLSHVLCAVSHGAGGTPIKVDFVLNPHTPDLDRYGFTIAGYESPQEPAYLLASSARGLGAGGLFLGEMNLKNVVDFPELYRDVASGRTGCSTVLAFSAPGSVQFSPSNGWAVGSLREARDRIEGDHESCPVGYPLVSYSQKGITLTRYFEGPAGDTLEVHLIFEHPAEGSLEVEEPHPDHLEVALNPDENGNFACLVRFECTPSSVPVQPLSLSDIFQRNFLDGVLSEGPIPLDLSIFTSLIHGSPSADQALLPIQEQGLLAGYNRFANAFGRDGLLSQIIYLPHLTTEFAHWVLRTQLSRVYSPGMESAVEAGQENFVKVGMACHEVTVGPYASDDGTPRLSYLMVDTNPLLVIASERTFSQHPEGLGDLLQSEVPNPWNTSETCTYQDKLLYAVKHLVENARAFAEDKFSEDCWRNLPEFIHPIVGDWADSSTGNLGTTRTLAVASLYAAALESAVKLLKHPEVVSRDRVTSQILKNGWLPEDSTYDSPLEELRHLAQFWKENYLKPFRHDLPTEQAKEYISSYCDYLGISSRPALSSLGDKPLKLYVMGLSPDGAPAFAPHAHIFFPLFFTEPSNEELDIFLQSLELDFPAGVFKEGVGPVIAAPLVPHQRAKALPVDYHLNSTWPFMTMMGYQAAAIQLTRDDLTEAIRRRIEDAHGKCEHVLNMSADYRLLELFGSSSLVMEDVNHHFPMPLRNRAFSPCAFQLWNTWGPAVQRNVADLSYRRES